MSGENIKSRISLKIAESANGSLFESKPDLDGMQESLPLGEQALQRVFKQKPRVLVSEERVIRLKVSSSDKVQVHSYFLLRGIFLPLPMVGGLSH